MNTLKLIAMLAIATGSIAVVFGTGAFAGIDADRIGNVGVADDNSGLLGISIDEVSADQDDSVTLATIDNNFGEELTIESVTVDDAEVPFNVNNPSGPDLIPSDAEGAEIEATIGGQPGTSGWVELTITVASPSGISVELTREVFIEIDAPDMMPIQNVEFFGGGNAEINTTEPMDVDLVVWTKEQPSGNFERTTLNDTDTETRLQPQLQGQGNIAAVYFPEYDVTFIHPELDLEKEEFHPWRAGDGVKIDGEISLGEGDDDSPGDGGGGGPPGQ